MARAAALGGPRPFGALKDEFGEDLLRRAAVWMTLRESKASFTLEGEADRVGRGQRFADGMARRTGQGEVPLSDLALAELQREILGDRTTIVHFGLRQSPEFVGETVRYPGVVQDVAPAAEEVGAVLEGLRMFVGRTRDQSAVMHSAVAAFGFICIHPRADGDGRVHRFLVNDILRRDDIIPDPVILPIAAVITDDAGERSGYARVLEHVSIPRMQAVRALVVFESTHSTFSDGVVSNFAGHGGDQARPLWRHPDLRPHVVFLANIIGRTLTGKMREESHDLRSHARARAALQEVVEMPDPQADRVLRSIEQNRGELSNVLAREKPVLKQIGVWAEIVAAVSRAFADEGGADGAVIGR